MTFGQKLRELREKAGFSQENIASMLFVTTQNVIEWENDETTPSADILCKLSRIFGISPDELSGYLQEGNFGQPIAKAEIVTDKNEINKIFRFKFLNSISALLSAFILFAIFLAATISIHQFIEPYNSFSETEIPNIAKIIFYPTALLISVFILCLIKNKAESKACNQSGGNLLFYNSFITIQNTDGTSCNIQYSSVKKIYELDYYLVMLFADGKITCIKKETSEGYFDYIINIFRSYNKLKDYTVTVKRSKPRFSQEKLFNIKSTVTRLTVLVIGSIYLSLLIWTLIITLKMSEYGNNAINSGLSFLPVLIPLASLIFGIVMCCKKIKSKRLIIASAIILFFTIIYSTIFSIIPLWSNEPESTSVFETVMKKQGLVVSDITTQRTENYLYKCYVASCRTGDYDIYCLEFDTDSSYGYTCALDFYNDKREEFEEKDHIYYYDDCNGSGYTRYYTGYDEDEYFVISINNGTVIYSCVDIENAEKIKDIYSKIVPFRIPFYGI